MKSILQDLRELKTGNRELRNLGLLVGGVFCLIGLWLGVKGKPVHPWLWTPGLILMVLGVSWPRSLREVYIGWMAMAMALGFVVSHVVLTLFFYLVITPTGWAARLAGKDFLSRKLDKQTGSYWIPRKGDRERRPAEYENQF